MKALAVVGNQMGLARLLVMPRLVGRAGLHGGEDADEPRFLAPLGEDRFHPVLFAKIPLADELDPDACFGCQLLGVVPNPVTKRLGKSRIVENPHLPLEQK